MTDISLSQDEDSIKKALGGDPAEDAVAFGAMMVGGSLTITAISWSVGAVIMAVILTFLTVLIVPSVLLTIPKLTFNRNLYFRPALAAVKAGKVNASWAIQGTDGAGIIVVDEPGQKLFVHDKIHAFADVKQIEWSTSGDHPFLRVVFCTGDSPVRTMRMKTHANAIAAGHRLHNLLSRGGNESQETNAIVNKSTMGAAP